MLASTCTWISKGLLFLLFTNLSVSISPQNGTTILPPDNNVPIEFPKNESEYPFVHNTTILKVLASHTSNDTEVDDLLHGGRFSNISHVHTSEILEIPEEIENSTNVNRKWDSELIENGSETEDVRENVSVPLKNRNRDFYGSRIPVVQGQLAAILACVFVLIAIIGYVGLLSWRRFLETRYGNREMLVNEEDFYDPSDMRHFSL
ncbi:hypothetical protein ILUMI_11646 [Ignelater luminosus]|uniref:Uncharacterized protein n=1 Tax=Ignelater luminosus TaxID=2038154 RepID=A0A8K0CVL0_IGNLU|nr:hypothetical protein ILUMI_11646 [Ignelater luminosus]